MDAADEPEPQDVGIPFTPHPTDPDGVVIPPPTPEQLADTEDRAVCKVYYREEWGGRLPKETPVMYTPVHKVVLSRTETDPCFTHEDCRLRVRQMQNDHMDKEGEPDIKYHFLVGGDGALYEGRGYKTVGRSYPVTPNNLQDLSKSCLEIAFIAKSETETSEAMQKAASACITLGRNANHIYKTFDLYFVANDDIVHQEQMGIKKKGKETSQLDSGNQSSEKVKSNEEPSGGSNQENSPNQLDSAQESYSLGTENDTKSELETGEPDLVQCGSAEFPSYSNVPQHNSDVGDKETKDDKDDVTPSVIVYRHVWGAQKPKWIKALDLPINKVAVSFTETEPCQTQEECISLVKELQAKHMEDPNEPDIKHNFLIGGDGQIYEGRGYTRVGPVYPPSVKKIEQLNETSIDIGIVQKHAAQPTEKVIKAISWCMSTGIHQKYIEMNFDTYYIANNEIIHVQHPVPGAEKRP